MKVCVERQAPFLLPEIETYCPYKCTNGLLFTELAGLILFDNHGWVERKRLWLKI